MRHDTIRGGKRSHIEDEQGNPVEGKKSQKQAKESQIHSLPLLGVPQNHQANGPNICREPRIALCTPLTCCFSFSEST